MDVPMVDDNTQVFESEPKPVDLRRAKRKCLVQLLAIMVVGGFMQGILPEEIAYPFLEIVTDLIGVIMAMRWCYMDARERDYVISFRLSLLVFLLFIVGFPYYILKTRSNHQALKVIGLSVLIFLLAYVLNNVSYQIGCAIYNAWYAG